MPEYFDISFITEKIKYDKDFIATCLSNEFNLQEGENNIQESKYALLAHKNIVLSTYQDVDADFLEFCISIPRVIFHRKSFDHELKQLTSFVTDCFKVCQVIEFALCGYETNSYHIWQLSMAIISY